MKKIITAISIATIILSVALVGCGSNMKEDKKTTNTTTTTTTTTTRPTTTKDDIGATLKSEATKLGDDMTSMAEDITSTTAKSNK